MGRARFLDFVHFVTLGAGRPSFPPAWFPLACALLCYGCTRSPSRLAVEDSQTGGRISVVAAPEAKDVMIREIEAFTRLYPDASITLSSARSRGAMGALLGASADLAVIAREIEPDEREAAVKGGIEVESYRFARDAIVLVVHPDNPVENASGDAVRSIYRDELHDWRALGGRSLPVVPVVQPLESDLTIAFVQRVMGGDPFTAPAHVAASDSEVVAFVTATPGAIGFVSSTWADRGAKALRFSMLTGMPFSAADPEAVHSGAYPLTRSFHGVLRPSGPKLAGGFVTFVTSIDGQRIVHEAGLVPTAVPVRFVRRSPMLSTHR